MPKYNGAYRSTLDEDYETYTDAEQDTASGKEAREGTNPTGDTKPASGGTVDWEKRYADLRSHTAKQIADKDKEVVALRQQVEKKDLKLPKSKEEIKKWVEKFPEAAAFVDSIARLRATEAVGYAQDTAVKATDERVQKLEHKIATQEAIAKLYVYHPDFREIKSSPKFGKWVDGSPEWVQKALYDGTDARAAADAVDLYKAQNGIASGKKRDEKAAKAAAEAVTRSGGTTAPGGDGPRAFRESDVSRMKGSEYEKNEKAIEASIKGGTFIYDMSGGAR